MRKRTVAIPFLVAGLLVTIAVSQVLGAEDVKKEIDAANAEFARVFAAGDAAGLAARYTEQGQILPPFAEVVSGRAAIEAYWKAAFQAGLSKVTLTALEVEAFGDTAIETGRAEITDAAGRQMDVAKYIVIWKRVNGEWKMHKDIFNSDLPPH